ncbi:hypothetical protein GOV12_03595 [Candidatus Pacearchaeota archaeon]|nr:hypothetical protein [Candidatus Pacearchaeota archaeon]
MSGLTIPQWSIADMNIVRFVGEKIIPESERAFLDRVRKGDLVKVKLDDGDCNPWRIFEGVLRGNNPCNAYIGFIEQEIHRSLNISSWRTPLYTLQFDNEGARFNTLYRDHEQYSPNNTPGWGERYDLLRRMGQWSGRLIFGEEM